MAVSLSTQYITYTSHRTYLIFLNALVDHAIGHDLKTVACYKNALIVFS